MLKSELDALKAANTKQRQEAVNLQQALNWQAGKATELIGSIDATSALLAKVVVGTSPPPPPPPPPPPVGSGSVLWTDSIQANSVQNGLLWGVFPVCNNPGDGPSLGLGSDAQGASLIRVPDPAAGGSGWALRHYINPTAPARYARSQFSIASWTNAAFAAQLAKGEVFIERKIYIPALPIAGDNQAWLALQDFHVHTDSGDGRRLDALNTWPGLFIGSPALNGCPAGRLVSRASNVFSAPSSIPIPIGRWFKLTTRFPWASGSGPVIYYIDNVEVCRVTMTTRPNNQQRCEYMAKLYSGGPWSPLPITVYSRDVRIGSGLMS